MKDEPLDDALARLTEGPSRTLSYRATRKYVGTYAYLDDWTDLGTIVELATSGVVSSGDPGDGTDPMVETKIVRIESDGASEPGVIRTAIEDSYTSDGCACEHDCCGCRSWSAIAAPIGGDVWRVVISSSRNY